MLLHGWFTVWRWGNSSNTLPQHIQTINTVYQLNQFTWLDHQWPSRGSQVHRQQTPARQPGHDQSRLEHHNPAWTAKRLQVQHHNPKHHTKHRGLGWAEYLQPGEALSSDRAALFSVAAQITQVLNSFVQMVLKPFRAWFKTMEYEANWPSSLKLTADWTLLQRMWEVQQHWTETYRTKTYIRKTKFSA